MKEFLIRRTDGDWFDFMNSQLPDILHPNSFPHKVCKGWGTHRIEVMGCQIAFSDEDPGIQVSFESSEIPDDVARRIVEEICQNMIRATGQQGEVVPL